MQRLTLRAEAAASPIWIDEKGYTMEPEQLGLTPQLCEDLNEWVRRLTEVDGWFQDDELERRFDEEGHALWERVLAEVGDRAYVAYKTTFSKERSEPPPQADPS